MKAPTSGPPSEEKAEVLCLQTGPTQTQWLVPNGCPVCDCLLAPFPPANARLVRTLIYISLGGVRLGVKEQSCSSLNPEFPEQHSAVIPRQPTQWPTSPFQSRAQNHLNKIRLHLLSPDFPRNTCWLLSNHFLHLWVTTHCTQLLSPTSPASGTRLLSFRGDHIEADAHFSLERLHMSAFCRAGVDSVQF